VLGPSRLARLAIALKRQGRVTREKYQIQIPLPPKIDPSVTMMQVEEKPDVTYSDVGGCKEQVEKLREVVEAPLLNVRSLIDCRTRLTPHAAREIRQARHRSAEGHPPLRPARDGQDAVRAGGGEPDGRDLHPRHRVGAGAEVRGHQEGVHHLLRRD
jgi:hypothetical protein